MKISTRLSFNRLLFFLTLLFSFSLSLTVSAQNAEVTINQSNGQFDPTAVNSASFTIIFDQEIDPASFLSTDITLTGTSGTVTSFTTTTVVETQNIVWTAIVTGMTTGDTVVATLDANKVLTVSGGVGNLASSSRNNSITYDATDTDGDGIPDATDIDDDNDGIMDLIENGYCDTVLKDEVQILFSEEFGLGTTRIQNSDIQNHTYDNAGAIPDGSYAVVSSLTNGLNFYNRTNANSDLDANYDLTTGPAGGSTNGRYLSINMKNEAPLEIYRQSFTDLTFGVDYRYRVDFAGLCDRAFCTDAPIFELQVQDSSGNILASVTSAAIGLLNDDIWRRVSLDFVAAETELDIVILNIQPDGASGNDVGVDNIVFGVLQCTGDNDFDGDGIMNSLDLDSDNDGIYDIIEAGGTDSNNDGEVDYVTAGNPATMVDTNNNGLIDLYDNDIEAGVGVITPIETTSGIADFLNLDSDADGCSDANEAYADNTADNNDGGEYGAVDSDVYFVGSTTIGSDGLVITAAYTVPANGDAVTNAANTDACSTIDLNIIKTVDKAVPKKGQIIVFTLQLKNSGGLVATGVQVKDILPAGLTYNAASSTIPASTTYTSVTGIWDLSSLTIAKDQTIELKIAATVNTTGVVITNNAEVFTAIETDKDSVPNSDN